MAKSKSQLFLALLQSQGINEYWCSDGFNPNDDYPYANLVIPSKNSTLAVEIMDLYNDFDNDDNFHLYVTLDEPSSQTFKLNTEELKHVRL